MVGLAVADETVIEDLLVSRPRAEEVEDPYSGPPAVVVGLAEEEEDLLVSRPRTDEVPDEAMAVLTELTPEAEI